LLAAPLLPLARTAPASKLAFATASDSQQGSADAESCGATQSRPRAAFSFPLPPNW
jgi:hypothetical protein